MKTPIPGDPVGIVRSYAIIRYGAILTEEEGGRSALQSSPELLLHLCCVLAPWGLAGGNGVGEGLTIMLQWQHLPHPARGLTSCENGGSENLWSDGGAAA